MTPHRASRFALIATCGFGYIVFHQIRTSIPAGFIHDSIPSLLLMLLTFGLVDAVPGIRFHSFETRAAISIATFVVAAVWFEWVVPRFYGKATADFKDAVAMFLGTGAYLFESFVWNRLAKDSSDICNLCRDGNSPPTHGSISFKTLKVVPDATVKPPENETPSNRGQQLTINIWSQRNAKTTVSGGTNSATYA